jgi:hypothetical protein
MAAAQYNPAMVQLRGDYEQGLRCTKNRFQALPRQMARPNALPQRWRRHTLAGESCGRRLLVWAEQDRATADGDALRRR